MKDLITGCTRLIAIAWRQHRGKTALAVVLMMAGAVAAPLTGAALRWLTDAAVAGQVGAAVTAGLVTALLAMATLTFSHFAHIAYFELSEISLLDLENQIILLSNGSSSIAHHEQPEYADQFTVLRRDIQRLRTAMQSLLSVAGLLLALVLTSVLLASLDLALLLLLPLALAPLVSARFAERMVDRATVAAAADNRMAMGLFRLTSQGASAKELRIFRLEETILTRHARLWNRATARAARAQLAATALRVLGQLVFAAGYLAGVLLVVQSAVTNHRGVGDVIMAIALAAQVNQQVGSGVVLLQDLQRMSSTLRYLAEFRARLIREAPVVPGISPPARLRMGIELAGVEFRYPGRTHPVLRDVNLTLPAGATVAIIGENGAGKTTLVKLLSQFYQPSAGQILVDGSDLSELSPAQWRQRVTAGFQDFVRFEFLARETVGVGDLPRIGTPDAVVNALRLAHAVDMVTELPEGLDTRLGKSYADGVEPSGGQWQKLALGRAFMREHPLLVILDEPTAALDPAAEHALFERYAEHARRTASRTGAITVLVSHRFSTVRMADLIVVMADGRIQEAGDHETLMRSDGLYRELYQLQAEAYS